MTVTNVSGKAILPEQGLDSDARLKERTWESELGSQTLVVNLSAPALCAQSWRTTTDISASVNYHYADSATFVVICHTFSGKPLCFRYIRAVISKCTAVRSATAFLHPMTLLYLTAELKGQVGCPSWQDEAVVNRLLATNHHTLMALKC